MPSLRELKLTRAKAYILEHPDESKEVQALGADVSISLIGMARAQLIKDGLLPPSRKAGGPALEPEAPSPPAQEQADPPEPKPEKKTKPASMLDSQAMQALADMIEKDLSGLDDDGIRQKLLKQCLLFAFNPALHPDTRMSASQMWAKLKERQREADLGPGAPTNFDTAVERLRDIMVACGPKITLAAVNLAFDVETLPNATPVEAVDTAQTPPASV